VSLLSVVVDVVAFSKTNSGFILFEVLSVRSLFREEDDEGSQLKSNLLAHEFKNDSGVAKPNGIGTSEGAGDCSVVELGHARVDELFIFVIGLLVGVNLGDDLFEAKLYVLGGDDNKYLFC